jgi:hypothetical protein
VTLLGAVAVKPPVYVCVPPVAPSLSVPVFANVTASVMLPVDAGRDRLNACDPTFSAPVVKAPVNVIVPVVLVRTTAVPVVTAVLKVVPPELVIVRFRRDVTPPTIPVTPTIPEVPEFRERDSVLLVVPLIVLVKEILLPVAALATVEIMESAVKTTGPVKVCVLLLVILPPILIDVELVRLNAPIGVESPKVDPRVIAPVPLAMVKFCAPLILEVIPLRAIAALVEVRTIA